MKKATAVFFILLTSTSFIISSCATHEEAEKDTEISDSFSSADIETKNKEPVILESTQEEKNKAMEIAEKGIYALQSHDYEGMAEYIDFEIWYYATTGKEGTKEEIANGLKTSAEESGENSIWAVPADSRYLFKTAEKIEPDYFILDNPDQTVFLSKPAYERYKIDKAYRINTIESRNSINSEMEVFVVEIGGVLKLDYAFRLDKEYHDEVLKIAEMGKAYKQNKNKNKDE